MQIEVLIKYVDLFKQGEKTVKERKKLLEQQLKKLLDKEENIKNTIERLKFKIKIYDEIVEGKRKDFLDKP